ncbi:MAG: poly-gamma-glutamate biosynthesis protein PgsC/CapC [Verrucomicrobiales bacterium]|jgi:poly-gamma-glutamate biosynthesis protein PgsC/CapC
MIDLLTVSIGVGLVVSLLFAEFFGFKAGGLVVPGYFAVFTFQPISILLTLGIAVLTYLVIRLVASIVIVYGKRRTALAILTGYVLGVGFRTIGGDHFSGLGGDYQVIGFIIPGLIALWMDRQGVLETITSLATVSMVTRLILILLIPTEIELFENKINSASQVIESDSDSE